MKKTIYALVVVLSLLLSMFSGFSALAASPGVTYQTHVQTYGWQGWKGNGQMSGTCGESKRLEGICIQLENAPANSSILYRTHVQTYGWQNWKSDGDMSGTTGEAKRLEAIQIKLTGVMATQYDVYYRVHAQTYGWLGWAKNGESAGTAGNAKRLEAIEIQLVAKGSSAPGSTVTPFISKDGDATLDNGVAYQTHVQTYGWQDWKYNGSMAGTTGEAKRLEGIQIVLKNQTCSGNVVYRTHVQTYGWQNWKSNGQMSGTSGEAKRLEAIQIKLTDEMAKKYDIYYRVHAQTYGWLDWAKNGASAGTEGLAKRLECIEIKLVAKGAAAPGSTEKAFVKGNGQFVSGTTGSEEVRPTEPEKPSEPTMPIEPTTPDVPNDTPVPCDHTWVNSITVREEGHYEKMAVEPGYDVVDAWQMHQICVDCGADITGTAHEHIKGHHPDVIDTEYYRYYKLVPEYLHLAESHPPKYADVWVVDAEYEDITKTCRDCGFVEKKTRKVKEHHYEILADGDFDNGYDVTPRTFCAACGGDITGNLNHTIYVHRTSYYTWWVPTRVVHYTGFVGCKDCGITVNSQLTDFQ